MPLTQLTALPVGRAADVAAVRRAVQRGDHYAIVGVNNMGKTAVLRAVGDAEPGCLAVYVDCNQVLEWTELGFYEVIIRAALDSLPSDSPARSEVAGCHRTLVAPTTMIEDAYAFVAALAAIIRVSGRLALLLDEFDTLLRRLDARVFLNLRGLADQYGLALTYVTATTHRPSVIRADVEPFYELFAYTTRYLSLLSSDEARAQMAGYAEERGVSLDDDDYSFAYGQMNGHPGLLRAMVYLLGELADERGVTGEERRRLASAAVNAVPNVQTECAGIWNELLDSEREALAAIVAGQPPTEPARAYLLAKHLAREGERGLLVFAPVFTAFVARERRLEPQGESLRVDTERGDVFVNGRPIPPLTDLEYRLLALLNDRRGQIVDKYQIVEKVWGEAYIDQVDDDRIERLVARVREKVEPDPRQPRFLTTVRGRGYRLKTE